MKTKSLCICQGGRVRSVALRFVLTDEHQHDALACGLEKQEPETMEMLYSWADRVWLLDARFVSCIPDRWKHKLTVLDVGPDRWGHENNGGLRDIVRKKIAELL